MASQSSTLMPTTEATGSPTTMTETIADKIANPTEIARTAEPFFRQATKCDKNEGAITALGTIAFISFNSQRDIVYLVVQKVSSGDQIQLCAKRAF